MQPAVDSPSATTSSSFAGFLAALATPTSKHEPGWNDDGLEDDIATLSYERALRAHSRYRPSGASDMPPADTVPLRNDEEFPDAPSRANRAEAPQAAPPAAVHSVPGAARQAVTVRNRDLKCSSITIRMSQEECAQLRRRAAEAGLTVSAYLRSCTFEAESLRAMVKDTLAQLNSANSTRDRNPSAPTRSSWRKWWSRLHAPSLGSRQTAQA